MVLVTQGVIYIWDKDTRNFKLKPQAQNKFISGLGFKFTIGVYS